MGLERTRPWEWHSFARKKQLSVNESISQPVIPPGWRAGSPELIHTPLRYAIDHNENQSSHPQNLELFRGHEAYYAILRWCYQKNNCIFGLPDPQNIGLAIFVFALNGSYLKDRKHRPETCMISQPTALLAALEPPPPSPSSIRWSQMIDGFPSDDRRLSVTPHKQTHMWPPSL